MERYQIFRVIYVVGAWFYLDELLAVSQKRSKTFNIHSPSGSKGFALKQNRWGILKKKKVGLEMWREKNLIFVVGVIKWSNLFIYFANAVVTFLLAHYLIAQKFKEGV